MDQVENKVAFITGGASGIGLGMARALGAAGMKLVIADISEERRDAAVAELRGQALDCMGVDLDVRSAAMWASAVDAAERQMGPIDILCNNAGVGQGNRSDGKPMNLTDISESLFRLVFEINVTGAFLGVKTVAPRLIDRGQGGHIVNTGSMASLIAPAGLGCYSASKFAVAGMTESLREELAPHGIGVSLLCPGGVQSNLTTSSSEQRRNNIGQDVDSEHGLVSTQPPSQRLMLANAVGDRVLAAIRANELYILTHPEYEPLVEDRIDAIRASWTPSAQPSYADPQWLLRGSRNAAYRRIANRDFT